MVEQSTCREFFGLPTGRNLRQKLKLLKKLKHIRINAMELESAMEYFKKK